MDAMALSLHSQHASWARTLPRPASMLSAGNSELHSSRSASSVAPGALASHTVLDPPATGPERRVTLPELASQTIPHSNVSHNPLEPSTSAKCAEPPEPSHQIRKLSIMSTDVEARSRSPSNSSLNELGGSICLCQREPHVPRPRNAFILYRQHQHAAVVARNPSLSNPDISKILGEQWRQLPEQTKEEWKALAEEEKTRHAQQHPDYRYKPKRNSKLNGSYQSCGLQLDSPEIHAHCHRCGGRTASTVHVVPVGHDKDIAPASLMPENPPSSQSLTTSPKFALARPYREVFPQPIRAQHEYKPYSMQSPFALSIQNVAHDEGPEAKRRRFNGNPSHAGAQVVYQSSRPSPRGVASPNQFLPQPITAQIIRPGNQHIPSLQRRDTHVTLPPLQIHGQARRTSMPSLSTRTQRGSVEPIIMAIPVLNKVKILSQISPGLSGRDSGKSKQGIRGTIIAVEGMNFERVSNMTKSLANHLEKEGKFAVRIFGGPDPHTMFELDPSKRRSLGHLMYSNILSTIQLWHTISAEMAEYVLSKPEAASITRGRRTALDTQTSKNEERLISAGAGNVSSSNAPRPKEQRGPDVQPQSPISIISPGTILQTADLSLESPSFASNQQVTNRNQSPTEIRRTKSRIPAAALSKYAGFKVRTLEETATQQHSTPPPVTPCSVSVDGTKTPPSEPNASEYVHPSLQDLAAASETMQQLPNSPLSRKSEENSPVASPVSPTPIPIAIVPHYQLTTVNACAISMPITDAYSPHSHWQWLATLWRGCAGPDITIVIETADDENSPSSEAADIRHDGVINIGVSTKPLSSLQTATSPTVPSSKFAPPHQGQHVSTRTKTEAVSVDVRLSDYKAVIVRTAVEGQDRAATANTEWLQSNGSNNGGRGERNHDALFSTSPETSSTPFTGAFPGLTGYSTSCRTTNTRADSNEALEAWEKAKRRVAFEVEEHLTK